MKVKVCTSKTKTVEDLFLKFGRVVKTHGKVSFLIRKNYFERKNVKKNIKRRLKIRGNALILSKDRACFIILTLKKHQKVMGILEMTKKMSKNGSKKYILGHKFLKYLKKIPNKIVADAMLIKKQQVSLKINEKVVSNQEEPLIEINIEEDPGEPTIDIEAQLTSNEPTPDDSIKLNQILYKKTITPFNISMEITARKTEWIKWKRSVLIFMEANDIESQERLPTFLNIGGFGLHNLYYSLLKEDDDKNTFKKAITLLDEHFCGRVNFTYERHVLRNIKQDELESFDSFLMKLREQALKCGFEDRESEFIRDQIVEGAADLKVREKILNGYNLSLEEAVLIGKAVVEVRKIIENCDTVKKKCDALPVEKDDSKSEKSIEFENNTDSQANNSNKECTRCGLIGHFYDLKNCKARNKMCVRCGKYGHLDIKCFTHSPQWYNKNRKRQRMNSFQEYNEYDYNQMDNNGFMQQPSYSDYANCYYYWPNNTN